MNIAKKAAAAMLAASLPLLAACGGLLEGGKQDQAQQTTPKQQEQTDTESKGKQQTTVLEAASSVLGALKKGDMASLAAWADPEHGVRFSPYAYVDVKSDLVFKQDELKGLMQDSTTYTWGFFDGSGEPIATTYADYHQRFVYDADFATKGKAAPNQILASGTTVNNIGEAYPRERYEFVEYYIAGVDPQYNGMDWRSLRLVFANTGKGYALVGIIHDQWTI